MLTSNVGFEFRPVLYGVQLEKKASAFAVAVLAAAIARRL